MKRELGFIQSLERYGWRIITKISPALPYVGVTILGAMMIASGWRGYASVASAQSLSEASLRAVAVGDYETARRLYEGCQQTECQTRVLGAESEIEERLYPERSVERAIQKYEKLLEQYPGHRDLYLTLFELNESIGRSEEAGRYREEARKLDPNHARVKRSAQ